MTDYKKFQDTMEYMIKTKPQIMTNKMALKGVFKDIAADISDSSALIDRADDADIVKLMKSESDYDVLYNKCMRSLKEKAFLSDDISRQVILAYRFLAKDGGGALYNIVRRESGKQTSNNSINNNINNNTGNIKPENTDSGSAGSVMFLNEASKDRYDAIVRYIDNMDSKIAYSKPCRVKVKNKEYYFMCDEDTIALTSEGLGAFDECGDEKNIAATLESLFNVNFNGKRIDINGILNKAKKNGYKFKIKSDSCKYFLESGDEYYNLADIERVYSILNDNKPINILYSPKDNDNGNVREGMFIKNDIGMAWICDYRILSPCDLNVLSVQNGSIHFEKKHLLPSGYKEETPVNKKPAAVSNNNSYDDFEDTEDTYKKYNSEALPGFRSGVWWKKIIGFLYYAMMVISVLVDLYDNGIWSAVQTCIFLSVPVAAFGKASDIKAGRNAGMTILYTIGYYIVYYIIVVIIFTVIESIIG